MLTTEQPVNNGRYVAVADTFGPPPAGVERSNPSEEIARSEARNCSKFLLAGATRPPLSDVLHWTDQILERLHKFHTDQPPRIYGHIAPQNLQLDASSNVELLQPSERNVDADSYKPLEQIWESLNERSRQLILDRYDADAEEWLVRPLDAASDIYSVGATVYAIATGVVPPDALDRSIAAIEGKPDPLRPAAELDAAIPAEISEVILKAMSLRRDRRYYSALILRQVFRTAAVKVKEREFGVLEPSTQPKVAPEIEVASPVTPKILTADAHDVEKERVRDLAKRIIAEKKAVAKVTEDRTPSPVLSNDLDASEILEIPTVAPTAASAQNHTAELTAAFAAPSWDHKHPVRSRRPLAIGVAAVVLVGAIGGGAYMLGGRAEKPNVSATQPVAEPSQEISTTTSVALPSAQTLPSPDAQSEPSPALVTESERSPRNSSAPPTSDKQKKPAAPQAKAPTPKKALTVDDLINDH